MATITDFNSWLDGAALEDYKVKLGNYIVQISGQNLSVYPIVMRMQITARMEINNLKL